jgi:hypothetical protein
VHAPVLKDSSQVVEAHALAAPVADLLEEPERLLKVTGLLRVPAEDPERCGGVHGGCGSAAVITRGEVEVSRLLMMGQCAAGASRLLVSEAKLVQCGGLAALITEEDVGGKGLVGMPASLAVFSGASVSGAEVQESPGTAFRVAK